MVLETPRLLLRRFSPEDDHAFYELNNDPEVLRYTGDLPFRDVEAAREFLLGYDHYARHGFGRWAVVRRADGCFLGWCGLRYTAELDGVDLGFRLHQRFWGEGYATEAAKGCVLYGFETLGLAEIWGRAMTANVASIRVLEKAGFTFVRPMSFDAHEGMLYLIKRPVD